MSRIFLSNEKDDWTIPVDYMTWVFIPRKWWSVKEWKLAIDLKKNFSLIGIMKEE